MSKEWRKDLKRKLDKSGLSPLELSKKTKYSNYQKLDKVINQADGEFTVSTYFKLIEFLDNYIYEQSK